MAGKKPAKPMAGQSKQVVLDPAIYGIAVKFFGTKSSPMVCVCCGRNSVRGMIRVRGDEYLCSLRCAEQSSKIGKENTGDDSNE
jgi:hypothetical protein